MLVIAIQKLVIYVWRIIRNCAPVLSKKNPELIRVGEIWSQADITYRSIFIPELFGMYNGKMYSSCTVGTYFCNDDEGMNIAVRWLEVEEMYHIRHKRRINATIERWIVGLFNRNQFWRFYSKDTARYVSESIIKCTHRMNSLRRCRGHIHM